MLAADSQRSEKDKLFFGKQNTTVDQTQEHPTERKDYDSSIFDEYPAHIEINPGERA